MNKTAREYSFTSNDSGIIWKQDVMFALKQICKMISSGEIPKEVYDKYLSETRIGFMSEEDLEEFLI